MLSIFLISQVVWFLKKIIMKEIVLKTVDFGPNMYHKSV